MPAADGTRSREASYYQSANRGKLSVAINMAAPEGQELIRALAAESDVVIENYKAGSLRKYGLDYESLAALNPGLVYCSVTGFGQSGPRAAEPGYDFIVQAMGGLMSITGERDDRPGGGPQKVGVAFSDLMTGMYAVVAIQAALISRARTGVGQHCDIALLDVQVASLANQSMNYLASGKVPGRYGNAHANIVPYQVFEARDAQFVVACGNDAQFIALSDAIGLPALPKDPRFAQNSGRVEYRDEIVAILADRFRERTAAEWIQALHATGVPVGAINDVAQALEEPQVQARDMLVTLPHPLNPEFTMIGSPIKLSRTPVRYLRPPPMLGEHTDLVLHDRLGLSSDRLAKLESIGAIGRSGAQLASGAPT